MRHNSLLPKMKKKHDVEKEESVKTSARNGTGGLVGSIPVLMVTAAIFIAESDAVPAWFKDSADSIRRSVVFYYCTYSFLKIF
jgi:hypothetical protein